MRLLSVFRKCLREQLRELWLLALVLILAPFFVFLMHLVYSSGTFLYKVVIIDRDQPVALPDGTRYHAGRELVEAITAAKNATGSRSLVVLEETDHDSAEKMLTNGKANALVELPEGLSRTLVAMRTGQPMAPTEIVYMGDMTSTSYMVAAVLAINPIAAYLEQASGAKSPIALVEKPLGGSGARSELDMAIPGLFVIAIIMLIFPVAMALARENENGCLRRLQLSRITAFDLLGGLSLVQVLVGIAAVLCAFATALAVGFESQGPIWAAIAVSTVASFAVIGVGLLVACFSRTVTEAFLLGNFPMMLLLFFSGGMFPIPKVALFTVGPVTVGLWDWMPTTHAVGALNKVLGLGLGLGNILYELTALVLLSALYFFGGVWIFKRRRMTAA